MNPTIVNLADKLYKAETNKTPIEPIRTAFPEERDIEAAYNIQQLVTQKKLTNGAKLIGKKIGLTSFAVQEQLGVNEPDFGILTDKMWVKNNGKIDHRDLMQPKAEAEWAFVLKDSLDIDNISLENIKEAIDYALVAIEIVGSRIKDWDIKITDTIADNASASHFVLGQQKVSLHEIDLVNCKMQLYKNSMLVSEGQGKACMGNPLEAVLWLAKTMQKRQEPLKSGDIILSGALGPMTNLTQGDKVLATIDNFDSVEFKVV